MKKLFIIILTFLIAPYALATSGACSGHNGVNCAAGPDIDGSVICNDGWSDSSVNYSTMVECKNLSLCSYPTFYGCSSEDDYNEIISQRGAAISFLSKIGSLGRSITGSPSDIDATFQPKLDLCRQQINDNQQRLDSYNQCIANEQKLKQDLQN